MDRPRLKPTRSDLWTSRALTALGWVTACLVPVVGLGGWLLMTAPALAADHAASGDPWPLVQAIADALGHLLRRVLRAF
jgi:hypothetical protein